MGVEPWVLAVDGGGSKTDVVIATADGRIAGRAIGPGSCPQVIGLDAAVAVIDRLIATARLRAAEAEGVALDAIAPAVCGLYISGLDFEYEVARMHTAALRHQWAGDIIADNDTFALLRAGTDSPDAVAVICGTGINCVGVREDGRQVRFPALGAISGDWGGGEELGGQALFHAVRAQDGRGPATSLETSVPRALSLLEPLDVTLAIHRGELDHAVVNQLVPVLLDAASAGDEVAIAVVERQAEEIVRFAVAALARLELTEATVPVVLGGGVVATAHPPLLNAITDGLARRMPQAIATMVREPPVMGALLLSLDRLGSITVDREYLGYQLASRPDPS